MFARLRLSKEIWWYKWSKLLQRPFVTLGERGWSVNLLFGEKNNDELRKYFGGNAR